MDKNELTPHFEELKKVLEGKIDDNTLMQELDNYVNKYRLDIEESKRGILRKYGGMNSDFVTAAAVTKKISDLNGTETNVDIVAKVVFSENKNITVKGVAKDIMSGILGDETGTVSFTIWGGKVELNKDEVYRFKNCYTKKWNDRIQVNLGSRGSVEKEENVSMNVPERMISFEAKDIKIGDIREGMGSVNVTGKIITQERRVVVIKGEEKTVYSGLMADDTGKIQYSAWNDFGLITGQTICVKNGYIRSWKGIPQLNLGDKCEISKVDDTFKEIELTAKSHRSIGEIARTGGGLDIEIVGSVVDIKTGSGIIKRCPECNRSILNDSCNTHGNVQSVPDLRMKLIIDDGTGAISAIVGRDLTEKLTGITLEQALDIAKARGPEYVIKTLSEKIIVKKVKISGNVMTDEYGPKMNVRGAEFCETDIKAEAEKLLKEVEAAL